jgi:hypothetical protein
VVNSVSAWLVLPFFAGAFVRSMRGAGAGGFLACGSELVGYYLTADLRGLSTGGNIVIFWLACAVLGGPVFGIAGNLWRRSPSPLRGLGPAVVAASFLGEGLWSYTYKLHYYTAAALWITIGLGLVGILNQGRLQPFGWLALTLPAALLGEIALTTIASQPF